MENKYLESILIKLEELKKDVVKNFGELDSEQLNRKPNENSWSIAQCLDHIITTNEKYFTEFEDIVKNNGSDRNGIPLLSRFFGKMLIKSVSPDSKKKMKAPKVFQPSSSLISGNIVEEFVKQQDYLIEIIKQSDKLDHKKVIITSPVSRFITYSLKDAITIIALHEERHILQACRILNFKF